MKKLWFAFKFVSLNYWKQQPIVFARLRIVVICFQICIFELLKTTVIGRQCYKHALWFAFKFVSLNYWKQLVNKSPNLFTGCDLLSNLYLWTIENNSLKIVDWIYIVVICFQICIFELLKTTWFFLGIFSILLWFAFKFVSLNYWKQLLWEIYCYWGVVICFQICIFELLKTTIILLEFEHVTLWFAFKFVSLNYWKQLAFDVLPAFICCDLLSNLYLWTIENNEKATEILSDKLWFAFKFVSLNYWKQLDTHFKLSINSLQENLEIKKMGCFQIKSRFKAGFIISKKF